MAWVWAVAAVSAALLGPVWSAAIPNMPRCLLRHVTGIPCPTCGSSRAALALIHGEVLDALRWNPAVTLAILAFGVGGVLAPAWVHLGGRLPVLTGREQRVAAGVVVGGMAVNWLYLVLTGV